MQAKQYEEQIMKLLDALELQKLKNASQLGRLRVLEEQLEQSQRALEEERNEKELILKNRNTSRLLLELQEERVQRLQDLEEIYAKDKQVESLTNEVNIMTKGVTETQEELLHREAEITGLRASVRCSAKLLHKAEKDFTQAHHELEETQLKLLDCKRRLTSKEAEVRMWIERYEQVMLDLHVSQLQLTQLARDASEKDAALTRGHCVVLDKTTQGNVVLVKPRSFSSMKDVGASDRLVRKFRQDLIPNRSQTNTASMGSPHRLQHSVSHDQLLQTTPTKKIGTVDSVGHASRECFQCPAESSSPTTKGALSPLKPSRKQANAVNNNHARGEDFIVNDQQQPGSKYLGYGLGLLKKNHIVPLTNP